MVGQGRLRISLNLAIAAGIFAIAMILVSNASMFAAAKGGHSIVESQPDIFVMRPGMGTYNDMSSPATTDNLVGGQAQFQNIMMRHGGVVLGYKLSQLRDMGAGYVPSGSVRPPSMYAVLLPGSEIPSIGDPGNMDPDNFRGTSFGDSKLQNEEAEFQDNLKNAIIHHGI